MGFKLEIEDWEYFRDPVNFLMLILTILFLALWVKEVLLK